MASVNVLVRAGEGPVGDRGGGEEGRGGGGSCNFLQCGFDQLSSVKLAFCYAF